MSADDLQTLIDDLTAIGMNVQVIGFDNEEPTQADRDYFTIVDFLEFCVRLTGENFIVNPSIAAHFLSLRIPSHLYAVSELPYNGTFEFSFNSFAREINVDRS